VLFVGSVCIILLRLLSLVVYEVDDKICTLTVLKYGKCIGSS